MSDPDQIATVASEWLDALNAGWASQDPTEISALFEPDGDWKDIVAFTWAYRTFAGITEIERGL